MCPACITTLALLAAATSKAGATALVAKKVRAQSNAKRVPTEPKSKGNSL
jgi:hypothetical protein